jgi:DNA-binding GntR family transcriptional regulator
VCSYRGRGTMVARSVPQRITNPVVRVTNSVVVHKRDTKTKVVAKQPPRNVSGKAATESQTVPKSSMRAVGVAPRWITYQRGRYSSVMRWR